ncbi:MAG TPA: AIPR family protein [Caldisericia bacterium]|nr:AIPR family protein [Caldisericia bacterium]HPF49738.1 AIPR family protein [Caldisericia bacterium]HPI84300.1 AIPR family protein [Caldisericia bacterium]HPQ93727.1 AIPR family protein [Caldisericia bacterium]HRV74849.1 AIPR family protein [Caldisericia bacterium]
MDESTAFEYFFLDTKFDNIDEEGIEKSICDGSMDSGIDAIYFDDNNAYFLTFKYTSQYDKSKNAFPEKDLDTFTTSIRRILEDEINENEVNSQLWDRISELYELIKLKPRIGFHLYICTNKDKPCEKAIHKLEDFRKDLFRYESSVEVFNQERIADMIYNKDRCNTDGVIRFIHKNFFDRNEKRSNFTGIIALVSAIDIVNLITKDGDINNSVFDHNIREYVKPVKNNVNRRILESAESEDNNKFWILNNGINIVCEKCEFTKRTSPDVHLTNFQIVNGGQTSRVLFDVHKKNPEILEDVLVLVRICETSDSTLQQKISETTNTQNQVKTRDLRSNDDIQQKLEREFLNEFNLFYERKKNQHRDKNKDCVIDAEKVAQVYLAYTGRPSDARDKKRMIWEDYYEQVFNSQISAKDLLEPYEIYKIIEKEKNFITSQKRQKNRISDHLEYVPIGSLHILFAAKLINERKGGTINTTECIEKAKRVVYELIVNERKDKGDKGASYSHNQFFKEKATDTKIKDYIGDYKIDNL